MSLIETFKLNNIILNNINITSHESNIIKSFENFYQTNENTYIFLDLISSKSNISIRLIDHFITKYSKTHKICYKLNENNSEHSFNVYSSYKQQLKSYQKKYFDPFSRGERIPFFINDTCIITTISQLNFFKWFISKKIYDYILLNQSSIDNDMNQKNRIIINTKINKKNINKPKIISNHSQSISNYNTYNNIYKKKTDNIIVSFSFN
jgi:hypothetical protein